MKIIQGEGKATRKTCISLLVILLFLFLPGIVWAGDSIKIVINKKLNKLAYLKNEEVIRMFPVATGRKPSYTPEGSFKIVRKLVNPYYTKLKIPGGSPKNPLGVRWLGLNALGTSGGTYGIHGTNNPSSIGKYASAGCIRMHNKDVIWLYKNTPLNTKVEIINGPWNFDKKPVGIKINGVSLIQEVGIEAFKADNRVMVPCRPVVEALGGQIQWNSIEQRAVISRQEEIIKVVAGHKKISVNEVDLDMETPALLRKGRLYIHIRALGEALGCKVEWDEANNTVVLTTTRK